MPHVRFTNHLRRFFPDLEATEVEGATVAEVVRALDGRWPGLAGYLTDDAGALRRHVNVFVGDVLIRDRATLGDAIGPDDEVFIIQALSGG